MRKTAPLDGAWRDRDRPNHPKLAHRAEAVSFGRGISAACYYKIFARLI
jgi:hypothetical protein